MNHVTHADLGGQAGHGRVVPEAEGERFHAAWEPRALALTLAMGAAGRWNIDMSRAARESLPDYARSSYYRIWIAALERLLIQRKLVSADELAHSLRTAAPLSGVLAGLPSGSAPSNPPLGQPGVLMAPAVAAALTRGSPTERRIDVAARFAPGAQVRTRSARVAHHTRLPGYAHGKQGTVESVLGAHVFADAHAQGLGEQPQWLYRVAFDARELWGADAAPGLSVSLDAWESYLEPAT